MRQTAQPKRRSSGAPLSTDSVVARFATASSSSAATASRLWGQVGTFTVPAGAEVISTEGMKVLPGLWDMHVHLMINGTATTPIGTRRTPPSSNR
jgi:imidazolonepropionase-like amidohydrolase